MRDLYSNIGARVALSPAVQSASIDGVEVDLKGFNRALFLVITGAVVGAGDFRVKLQESDVSGSGYVDVDASQFNSNAPTTLAAATVYKLGYRGTKRYTRLSLIKTGGTSIAVGAVAELGDPAEVPVA